jgi:hypothetical protein
MLNKCELIKEVTSKINEGKVILEEWHRNRRRIESLNKIDFPNPRIPSFTLNSVQVELRTFHCISFVWLKLRDWMFKNICLTL